MTGDELFNQIHEWATAQAEGRLTADEAARMEALILSDPEARRLYVQYVRETASLRWWAGAAVGPLGDGGDRVSIDDADADAYTQDESYEAMVLPAMHEEDAADGAGDDAADEAVADVPPIPMPPPEPPRRARWPWAVAAGVLLAVGVTFTILQLRPSPVATLLWATGGARWDAGVPAGADTGTVLKTGRRSLLAGAARIRFDGGAEVIVRAPAEFELTSKGEMRLTRGRLTAEVGPEAVGFTVRTPSAVVVDLGTEFGVDVDAAGATEAHVARGAVELKPAAAGASAAPTKLTADTAARVEPKATVAAAVPYRAAEFAHALTVIDLVDVVAGGDGTQGRRNAGVDARTGNVVTVPPTPKEVAQSGDGKFHPVPQRPLIAGVFIPRGGAGVGGQGDVLDPDGNVYKFPKTQGLTWYWLWAGGSIPVVDDPDGMTAFPTKIGAIEYNAPGHGTLLLRSNKGVTFDLAAIRAKHPGLRFARFRAVCANTSLGNETPNRPSSNKSDFWALVDGQLKYSKTGILRTDAPFHVSVDLPATARYLTLVATDGGDTYHLDWITLGDPRLE